MRERPAAPVVRWPSCRRASCIRIDRHDHDLADQLHPAIEDADGRGVGVALRGRWRQRLAAPPPLGLEVGHVLGVGAEEEVVGVHAVPLVAAMADVHARRDRPMGRHPGEAVREVGLLADADHGVAVGHEAALPDQAAGDRVLRAGVGEAPLGRPVPAAALAMGFRHAPHHRRG